MIIPPNIRQVCLTGQLLIFPHLVFNQICTMVTKGLPSFFIGRRTSSFKPHENSLSWSNFSFWYQNRKSHSLSYWAIIQTPSRNFAIFLNGQNEKLFPNNKLYESFANYKYVNSFTIIDRDLEREIVLIVVSLLK